MRTHIMGGIVALIAAVSVSAAGFDAARATNGIGLAVFRQVGGTAAGGNLIVSPYSIEAALALAYAGADGATRNEMQPALHFPSDDAAVENGLRELRADFDAMVRASQKVAARKRELGGKVDTIIWHSANRIFAQKGYSFRPEFVQRLADVDAAPLGLVDFQHNPDAARREINGWVEQQTANRIRNLIDPVGIGDTTRMVLANALYLKAPWASPFSKSETTRRPFHLRDGSAPKVRTMMRKLYTGYVHEADRTVVTLDFTGGALQLVVILPDEGVTPEQVITDISADDFARYAKLGAERSEVALYLPKFRIEAATLRLKPALEALGVRNAFDDPPGSANFDRIAPRSPNGYLALGEVFHRTFVALDEEGVEAAAASAITMLTWGVEAIPPRPIEIHVDRPFLFAIQHRPSGACLFLGRVSDPR